MSADTRARLIAGGDDPDQKVKGDFTLLELHEAFDLVKNQDNWKDPINATIKGRLSERTIGAIGAATIFFAGSPAETWYDERRKATRIKADGYYVRIGA